MLISVPLAAAQTTRPNIDIVEGLSQSPLVKLDVSSSGYKDDLVGVRRHLMIEYPRVKCGSAPIDSLPRTINSHLLAAPKTQNRKKAKNTEKPKTKEKYAHPWDS